MEQKIKRARAYLPNKETAFLYGKDMKASIQTGSDFISIFDDTNQKVIAIIPAGTAIVFDYDEYVSAQEHQHKISELQQKINALEYSLSRLTFVLQ